MDKKTNMVRKIGWIIKDIRGTKIWKHPFYSREEVDKEFRDQVKMIQKTRPTFKGENWKIEPFEYSAQEDSIEENPFKDFESL